ncbi:MAG: hypothetical protein ABI262_16970 [Microcoleus sp.]
MAKIIDVDCFAKLIKRSIALYLLLPPRRGDRESCDRLTNVLSNTLSDIKYH